MVRRFQIWCLTHYFLFQLKGGNCSPSPDSVSVKIWYLCTHRETRKWRNQLSLTNQMLGKMHVVWRILFKSKVWMWKWKKREMKMRKFYQSEEPEYENGIFPDRDPHVEIQSEMDIASCWCWIRRKETSPPKKRSSQQSEVRSSQRKLAHLSHISSII